MLQMWEKSSFQPLFPPKVVNDVSFYFFFCLTVIFAHVDLTVGRDEAPEFMSGSVGTPGDGLTSCSARACVSVCGQHKPPGGIVYSIMQPRKLP